MKERLRQYVKRILRWAFKEELKELDDIHTMLGGRVSISADIHQNSDSWAVISLRGEDRTYIKFIDLGKKHIKEIAEFLRNYEDVAVDANPMYTAMLKKGTWL
jgi:predicted metal-dependent hydrolase